MIVNAKEEDIVQVPSPVGLPGRAIRNKFSDYVQNNIIPVSKCNKCIKGCKVVGIPYCITEKLSDAVKGDVENGLVFSGAKAYMVNKIQTVEEMVNEIMSEYNKYRLSEVSV
jgi:NAD(P)H-dependent flavin oxidoreductase YrpB (nitropropane dioxygenase family)